MTEAGRVPICSVCLGGLEDWGDELRCVWCRREVSHEDALDADGSCGACRSLPRVLDGIWASGPYRGGLRKTIHLLKYDGMRPLASLLGGRSAVQTDLRAEADLIVPTPLHWTKRWQRGFNQSLLLAAEVSRRHDLPCVPRALRRKRATPPQAGLSGTQRRASLRGAFTARRSLVEGRRILLIDDVVTTGATLEACARALKRAGAKRVTAWTAARAQLAHRAL